VDIGSHRDFVWGYNRYLQSHAVSCVVRNHTALTRDYGGLIKIPAKISVNSAFLRKNASLRKKVPTARNARTSSTWIQKHGQKTQTLLNAYDYWRMLD